MVVNNAKVAPGTTVISVSGSYFLPYNFSVLADIDSRNGKIPGMGAYWLWPSFIALVKASRKTGEHSKSGNPCERFTALCCLAKPLISVKIVVPVLGNLEEMVNAIVFN